MRNRLGLVFLLSLAVGFLLTTVARATTPQSMAEGQRRWFISAAPVNTLQGCHWDLGTGSMDDLDCGYPNQPRVRTVTNCSTTDNIMLGGTDINSTTGYILKPGVSVTFSIASDNSMGLADISMKAIAASGTPTICVLESF